MLLRCLLCSTFLLLAQLIHSAQLDDADAVPAPTAISSIVRCPSCQARPALLAFCARGVCRYCLRVRGWAVQMQLPPLSPSYRLSTLVSESMEVGEVTTSELDDLFRRHHDQLWRRLEVRLAEHNDELKEAITRNSAKRLKMPRGQSAGSMSKMRPLSPSASQLRLSGTSSCLTSSRGSLVPPPVAVHPPPRSPRRLVLTNDLPTPNNLPGAVEIEKPVGEEPNLTPRSSVGTGQGHAVWKLPGEGELEGSPGPKFGSAPSIPAPSSSANAGEQCDTNKLPGQEVPDGFSVSRPGFFPRIQAPGEPPQPPHSKTSQLRRCSTTYQYRNTLVQEKPKQDSRLAGFVLSDEFDVASSVLILVNCMFIACQLEYVSSEAERRGHDVVPAWSLPIEIALCFVFTVEFILRCWVHGKYFFQSKDWAWTIFDGLVVAVSFFEVFYEWASSESTSNTTSFRAVRTLRTTRAVRAVRVFRVFRELRMFVCSILGCFKALIWSAVVLVLCWYVCSIVLTTATYEQCSIGIQPFHKDCGQLRERFGTLRRSVLSLYMSMSGGVDWGDIYQIMDPVSDIYKYIFLFYLFFTMFGVLNIVTGIFVEVAKEAAQTDRDILVRSQMRHQDKYANDMISLFQEIDHDGSGMIDKDEFQLHLKDERALAYFEAMKLDIVDVATLFDLIDTDHSGGIDIEEFLLGCQRLKGESRAFDLAVLRNDLANWIGQFYEFAEHIDLQLGQIAGRPSNITPADMPQGGQHSERRRH